MLDQRNPVLYVILTQCLLGKLPVVSVGDTGTIPHHLRNVFPGAPGDRKPGSGDDCWMWVVNSRASVWSRDMLCIQEGKEHTYKHNEINKKNEKNGNSCKFNVK